MAEYISVSVVPMTSDGFPVNPEEIELEDDGIMAVLPDDRIVKVVGWMRVRVGAAGTGESASPSELWECILVEQGEKGLYGLIKGLREAVKAEIKRRESIRFRKAVFEREAFSLGAQLLWDRELVPEVLEDGIEEWLKGQF